MKISKIIDRCKIWVYEYLSEEEKEEHKQNMITAQFQIVHESGLTTIYSQVIK